MTNMSKRLRTERDWNQLFDENSAILRNRIRIHIVCTFCLKSCKQMDKNSAKQTFLSQVKPSSIKIFVCVVFFRQKYSLALTSVAVNIAFVAVLLLLLSLQWLWLHPQSKTNVVCLFVHAFWADWFYMCVVCVCIRMWRFKT